MKKLTVCLIDADSVIPNIPLMKLSTYHKSRGDKVFFFRANLPYYPTRQKIPFHGLIGADITYASVVYEGNKEYISGDNLVLGGTGVDLTTVLSEEIEKCELDYSLYPDNNISYGFISRGCIRNCPFCVVQQKEGKIRQVSAVDDIVRHKVVKFLDNNFLALPNHKELLKEIIAKKIKCHFNQGLDIRLVDEENSELLHKVHYIDDYIFAFDDYKLLPKIEKQIQFLSWRKDWDLKFYVYTNPNNPLSETIKRIEWLKEHRCLAFLMRDISCWSSELSDFYVDLAGYCNRPVIYKNNTFEGYIKKIYVNQHNSGLMGFLSQEQIKSFRKQGFKDKKQLHIDLYNQNK
jgi:hypothetical protein